ncbi:hypothetical protein [Enterococcus pallens]|uniref:Uncharacterized protein n=1 Tax=Enterococcus pallens ATCC BAA-351 TaxID=1158607 RepID=R2SEV0_9ENTE|nr:hypothetical protein [Enterococcus pallens]EOH86709.1 hypothetical protein UAU_05154 [Enterococcus pallens ATCC BAA-351]EOU18505.1 hypothetical protein I588_03499 [Enterococcus pallens ATCC BAA-351]OJG76524.1 hypothetical protein RV10_GL003661 [Enterococcus pallens]
MLALKSKNGNGIAIPIEEFDKIQKKNLQKVKYEKKQIAELSKISTFYPEVRYQNVARVNEDDSMDIIVDSGVSNEIHTGFLPKRFYKALRVKKEKSLLSSKWNFIEIVQISEKEIISQFNQTVPIKEIEQILEAITKKGVKYFG